MERVETRVINSVQCFSFYADILKYVKACVCFCALLYTSDKTLEFELHSSVKSYLIQVAIELLISNNVFQCILIPNSLVTEI